MVNSGYPYVVFICSADIFTRKNIVIMCFIACYYPLDIPCKLDDVEEIYINVLVYWLYCPLLSDQSCLIKKSN